MSLPQIFIDNTINEIIHKYGFRAKKSLGQNFIVNPSLTRKIVRFIAEIKDKTIVEVGSGPGCLTMALLEQQIRKLIIVEKDQDFSDFLNQIKKDSDTPVELIFNDILKADFASFSRDKVTIIANLPYNISTPFLLKSCREHQYISEMLLMFQKEVADRIVAGANNKQYGRLSVMAQSFFDVKQVLTVNPEAFSPQPKVKSAIVHFKYNKKLPDHITYDDLSHSTELLFRNRRKKISFNLAPYNHKLNLDLNLRAENLALKDFYHIAEVIKEAL